MKRVLCLCICVLLMLAGCSSVGSDDSKPLIRVGFSQLGSESDWRVANTASMISALCEDNGYELLFDNAKQKQENQFLAIRNFIQQDVDYIVLAPIAETGWDKVLMEAKHAGIPVIIVDRQIAVADDSLYTSWVGSDFLAEGETAVQWMEEHFAGQGTEEDPIRIMHIQGTDGATAQILRTRALNEAVEAHQDWTIVCRLKGEFTEAKSYELVRDFLVSHEAPDVIYSENDNMSFGAMKALDEAGISYGPEGQVAIVSFDAAHKALEYCLAGKMDLCVECNPLHGPRVDKIIKQLEQGEVLPKLSYVEEIWFTPDTLTEEIIAQRDY